MKNILFLIAMLFGVAYGQTPSVGQFRYDTTKFLKVGGFNEVKIQNSTMDSTGGVFQNVGAGWGRWVKARAITGGFVIGTDTILVSGSGGGSTAVGLVRYPLAADSTGVDTTTFYISGPFVDSIRNGLFATMQDVFNESITQGEFPTIDANGNAITVFDAPGSSVSETDGSGDGATYGFIGSSFLAKYLSGTTISDVHITTGEARIYATQNNDLDSTSYFVVQPEVATIYSKKVIINNSDSTTKVGIGTTTPDSTLTVVGGLHFDLPTKGANKVLTSDADGNATWQTPGSGSAKQTDTANVTISNTTTWFISNPYSALTAQTLTMPASPTDGQEVLISFGGHITTNGAAVVNTFTLTPNSGQAIVGQTVFYSIGTNDNITIKYNSTNSSWYKK